VPLPRVLPVNWEKHLLSAATPNPGISTANKRIDTLETSMSKNKVNGQIKQARRQDTKPYARLFGMEEMQFKGTVLKTAGKTQVYFGNAREELEKRK